MRTLDEDLLLMDTLHGEALDRHLYEMKARYISPEDKESIRRHLDKELTQIENSVESIEHVITIQEQLKEVSAIVPIAYIAKTYFSKSAAWLYQRINGYKVRGKIYRLNEDEVAIFNNALQEIGNKISSLSITR